ncbi:MAG TPA: hypothetical protein VMY06_12595 [Sedimentisphaerales bacterium]|nr:hypothetical protein [Sedimentisphaerales bacterium]
MTVTKHEFNEGTRLEQIFTILSDTNWHCGKHELPGTQPAKAIQIIRHHGFRIENSTIYCDSCGYKTVHRRLLSTEPEKASFVRLQLPGQLRKRVLKHYQNIEAITLREMLPNQLEVDHRFPQVRWSEDESYDPEMSEQDLHSKFQLLTRQHNLWKSRYCERCVQAGERGTFIGINFFYEGGPRWDRQYESCDERGCRGCFWYNPELWREALNELIADRQDSP